MRECCFTRLMEFPITQCWLEAWEGNGWETDGWMKAEMSCEVCGKVGQNWLKEKWWSVYFTSACLCEKWPAPLPCWIDWICMSLPEGVFVWWHQQFWWQRCTKIQILLISHLASERAPVSVKHPTTTFPLFLFNLCFRNGTRGHCKLPLHLSPFNYANGIHYHRLKCCGGCSLIWRWIRVSAPAEVFECGYLHASFPRVENICNGVEINVWACESVCVCVCVPPKQSALQIWINSVAGMQMPKRWIHISSSKAAYCPFRSPRVGRGYE